MQLQPSKNTHFEKGTTPFWLTPPPLERDIVPFYGIFFFDGFPNNETWADLPTFLKHILKVQQIKVRLKTVLPTILMPKLGKVILYLLASL